MQSFDAESLVPAGRQAVWSRVCSPEGINHELAPFLRMTVPRRLRGMSIDAVEPATHLGRSWLLLFGLLPIDYDDITIAELEPGRRFLECSTMASMRLWRHERTLSDAEGGTTVSDRLTFELRPAIAWIPGLAGLFAAALRKMFAHRHARLAAHYSDERGSLTQ